MAPFDFAPLTRSYAQGERDSGLGPLEALACTHWKACSSAGKASVRTSSM